MRWWSARSAAIYIWTTPPSGKPLTAARLEQAAIPGSILISPETLNLAEGYVTVQSLGPMAIKGLPLPVEVFQVVGAATVRSRLQAAAARGFTRFVGREAEINQLRQALSGPKEGTVGSSALWEKQGLGSHDCFGSSPTRIALRAG